MKVLGIIPARMASVRFPRKPLINIGGKSMIQRVYEQAIQCKDLDYVVVATDHQDIVSEVENFGGSVIMTGSYHLNGTERCAEVLQGLDDKYDIVINIQGDEPFFEIESIKTLLACFNDEEVSIASLAKKITQEVDLINPSVVKLVFDKNNKALYFSRAAIPYHRDTKEGHYFKHIGIYAFKSKVLLDLVKLAPSALEQIEKLEQLRWLEHGYEISLGFTEHDSNSVDTPEDLIAIKKQFNITDL
jgi:3-deoxy-manno-octulosonate cytidylyltransferase (CMP-KDO synthetase)